MRRARDLNSSCVAEHVGIWNAYLPRFMDKYEHLETYHIHTRVSGVGKVEHYFC